MIQRSEKGVEVGVRRGREGIMIQGDAGDGTGEGEIKIVMMIGSMVGETTVGMTIEIWNGVAQVAALVVVMIITVQEDNLLYNNKIMPLEYQDCTLSLLNPKLYQRDVQG
jgi:hypothetical protein